MKANIKIFFFNPAEKTEEEKIADASSNLNDTNMNQQTNDVATSENLAKTGPVNPTNPNALENQPAGNGNAESLLHNKTADEDSNDQGGKTAEQQSVQEESLASKPEATNSGAGAEVDNEGGDTANNNKSDGPGVDSGAVINGGDASITGPGNPEGGAAATTETGTGINDGGGNAGAGDTGGNLNP